MVRLAIIAVLASTAVAHADTLDDQRVDPDAASKLSTIGAAVPIAAIGFGTLVAATGSNNAIRDFGGVVAIGGALAGVVTPSLGQLYSHRYVNGTMAMRAGGLLVGTVGLILAFNNEIGDCAGEPDCHLKARTIGIIAGGAALYLGGIAIDVLTARSDARAWNDRHLQIAPTAMRTPTSTVPGVALALTF